MRKFDPKKLKKYRKEKGLSIDDFANLMGIGRTLFQAYESGQQEPTENIIAVFCKVLELESTDMLYTEQNENPNVQALSSTKKFSHEKLKQYLEEKGFSKKEFADLLGIPRITFHYYETGEQVPNANTVAKICDVLGLEWIDMLYAEQNTETNLAPRNFNYEKLKEYRIEQRFTMRELAEIAGISTTYYHAIEKGEVIPNESIVVKFFEILELESIDLLYIEENLLSQNTCDEQRKFSHEKLKEYRMEQRFSMRELAELADMSTTYYHAIENGEVVPHENIIGKFFEILELESIDLLYV